MGLFAQVPFNLYYSQRAGGHLRKPGTVKRRKKEDSCTFLTAQGLSGDRLHFSSLGEEYIAVNS